MNNQKKILILALVFLTIGGVFVAKRFSKKEEKEETKIAENVKKNEKNADKKEEKKDDSNAKNNEKKDEKSTKDASYPLDADENINFEELKAMGRPIIIDFSQAH